MSRLYLIAGLVAILALSVPAVRSLVNRPSLGQAAIPTDVLQAFSSWRAQHSRKYTTPAEQEFRLKTFYQNFMTVKIHNANNKKSFAMALNHMADLTAEEFRSKLVTTNFQTLKSESGMERSVSGAQDINGLGQSANFDWRSYLQQQTITASSSCNDNYAWVGAVVQNADYFLRYGGQNSAFSPQTYIDCSGNFGNSGCNGGWANNCFKYSQQWGVATMSSYPYYGVQRPCKAPTGYYRNANINGIPQLSNTVLYNTLASKLIISVAIDISGAQFYSSGVFTGPCTTNVNHGLVLVGAGIDGPSGLAYWTMLNTWGPSWGEGGYMRIARFTVDGNPQYSSCGLNMYASLPTF